MDVAGRTTEKDCLTTEQWRDSQKHEASFWQTQAKGNIEQKQRNHYYRNALEDGCEIAMEFFAEDFSESVIADIGSGPEGILHVLKARRKIAVDPLMGTFRQQGYDVEGDDVECMCSSAEIFQLPEKADYIVCLNAVDHFQSPRDALKNMKNNMADQGELLLITDLRTEDKLDCYHKLSLREAILYEWVTSYFEVWLWHNFPHQKGNPIRQIVTRCVKSC